ncbi:hypothetical protein MAC3UK_0042 [Bdellovibrio phage MAC3UK]|nr:hypothetical protein MAC3UK_0042 [Bdellovibrio phage MAC3UK]
MFHLQCKAKVLSKTKSVMYFLSRDVVTDLRTTGSDCF